MATLKETLLSYIAQLEAIAQHMWKPESMNVMPAPFGQFRAGCLHLVHMLGAKGQHWAAAFSDEKTFAVGAARMYGTLQAIKQAISLDLLVSVEDFVMAEAFADLLEQAEYLLAGGYFLAAGVLGRAVLEEHLRKSCERAKCVPRKHGAR